MVVLFPADVETRVRKMVESGRYRDAGEALREAVDLLDERDRRLEWLRAAIAKSDEQIERGEGIPYTRELLDEIDREVDERIRRGDRPIPMCACAALLHDGLPPEAVGGGRRIPEVTPLT